MRRDWDGDEWEVFARKLVQLRHGPTNVQTVPDEVQGDCGLEYFTVDGCLYQSYAPEEVADKAKAASAMKSKASRDLAKLIKYKDKISDILGTIKAKRWIMVCPFLDNKDVIKFIQTKVSDLKLHDLDFVDPSFHALVQSQADFPSEFETLKKESLGVPISIKTPSSEQVDKQANDLDDRLQDKLKKAFPEESPEKRAERKVSHVTAFLRRENALANLKDNFPDLWEIAQETIDIEEERLGMIGATGAPRTQLSESLDRINGELKTDLPSLGNSSIRAISQGTLSDWLIRCPLDFPDTDLT